LLLLRRVVFFLITAATTHLQLDRERQQRAGDVDDMRVGDAGGAELTRQHHDLSHVLREIGALHVDDAALFSFGRRRVRIKQHALIGRADRDDVAYLGLRAAWEHPGGLRRRLLLGLRRRRGRRAILRGRTLLRQSGSGEDNDGSY
jgi:hypothetical protein